MYILHQRILYHRYTYIGEDMVISVYTYCRYNNREGIDVMTYDSIFMKFMIVVNITFGALFHGLRKEGNE